jgi:hypothetical protein
MVKQDELQIDRADSFLVKERRVQRAGTAVLAVFALAGAAGVFGEGPLSPSEIASGPIHVRFERFARATNQTLLVVDVDTAASDGTPVAIGLSRVFLDRITLDEVRPSTAHKGYDRSEARFEVPAYGGRAHFELIYQPVRSGLLDVTVTSGPSGTARFWQLVHF